jgi:hypothetical protein
MTSDFPSVAEIERILAMPDPVLRNLHITHAYHRLAASLAALLGPSVNWCAFATWASKQAGQTIRREDLPNLLDRELDKALDSSPALGELVRAAARFKSRLDPLGVRAAVKEALLAKPVFDRASAAVSRGNFLVFEEIGREFSRFLAAFAADIALDEAKLARFVEALRPGDPPEGRGYLRRAFAHFAQARFEPHPKARAERILLANLEIAFHEQTRLQPAIADALEAAFPDREALRRHLLRALFPRAGMVFRMRLRLPRLLRRTTGLDRALDALFAELRGAVRRAVTEALLRLESPGGVLRLGRDLERPFPASLATLADSELRELVARLDAAPQSLAGSGAEDWASLADRTHFVADYFRCFQEEAALLGPPFTSEQVAELLAGRRPSGRL